MIRDEHTTSKTSLHLKSQTPAPLKREFVTEGSRFCSSGQERCLCTTDENCLGSWHDPAVVPLLPEEKACEILYDAWPVGPVHFCGEILFRNVVGILLPLLPWNVQWAHSTYSELISLSIAAIIKKMLKLHLSRQRNLWWREVGFFLNLLLCRLVCSWIGWLADWCYSFSPWRGRGRFVPASKGPYWEILVLVISSS